MDVLDEDLLRLWKLLNEQEVQYIMVGGISVNIHGFARFTNDIDIWINDTLENRMRFGQAMQSYGFSGTDFIHAEFVPGWSGFYLAPGIELDILIEMKGLEEYTFEECLEMSYKANIESLQVPFLHINQLIQNKKAVNRPKDQIDITELEKIIALKNKGVL